MSHFLAFVLIPKHSPDVHQAVATLLAPFDESLEAAPYSTECACIGVIAHEVGIRMADRTIGPIDNFRARYGALDPAFRPPWDLWIADWQRLVDLTERTHSRYRKPDPDCEDCHGSGQMATTYNPQSQWDWWVIGGRWDGWLGPDNCVSADAAAQRQTPFALVTPDGAWHQKGQMGWFGQSRDNQEPAVWNAAVQNLLLSHSDALVVGCDLHI